MHGESLFTVDIFLILIGLVIITGFLSGYIFEKLRIPDVLILLGVGVVIGQWLGPQQQQMAQVVAPYFGSLAIIMILFEGGLSLDFDQIKGQFRKAFWMAFLTFFLSQIAVAVACVVWLKLPILTSLMFGTIIGCTSSAIVIPTIQRSRAPENVRALLTIESVFSDTIAVVAMTALLDVEVGLELVSTTPLRELMMDVVIGMVGAVIVGIIWLNVLEWTKIRPLSYLWTFAILVLTFSVVHKLGGSGELTVFFLALLISNSGHLPKFLVFGHLIHTEPEEIEKVADETVRWFHAELTFLIRSFFFVYIGVLFQIEYVQGLAGWLMVGFTAILCLARALGIWLIQRRSTPYPRQLLWAFFPRGLTSAVLATMPLSQGVPFSNAFLKMTIPIILTTNVIMTLWVFAWELKNAPPAEAEA